MTLQDVLIIKTDHKNKILLYKLIRHTTHYLLQIPMMILNLYGLKQLFSQNVFLYYCYNSYIALHGMNLILNYFMEIFGMNQTINLTARLAMKGHGFF